MIKYNDLMKKVLMVLGVYLLAANYPAHALEGTQDWAFATGNSVDSSPVIAPDGTVYIGSSDDRLYAIDGSSGGLAPSPWPMFHRDVKHSGNVAGQISGGKKVMSGVYLLLLVD